MLLKYKFNSDKIKIPVLRAQPALFVPYERTSLGATGEWDDSIDYPPGQILGDIIYPQWGIPHSPSPLRLWFRNRGFPIPPSPLRLWFCTSWLSKQVLSVPEAASKVVLKRYLVILTTSFMTWIRRNKQKCLFPKLQLITILRFQVMHDYVCFIDPIDYCVEINSRRRDFLWKLLSFHPFYYGIFFEPLFWAP